jgi:hypothetical protein
MGQLRENVGILLACAAFASLMLLYFVWREQRLRRRRGLLVQIMDLADALERELLETRARLREVPALATSLPLSAKATLAAEPLVQDALRDLLAHRLWLREHAASAAPAELARARDALVATRVSLTRQLARLADVRAVLADARAALDVPAEPRR